VVVVLASGATLFLVAGRRDHWQLGIGLAMCGSLLVTPYLWNYDQMLLVVPALIALCCAKRCRLLGVAAWFIVLSVLPWGLFWIANWRGFDPLSALVTVAVTGYLCASCWGSGQLLHSRQAVSTVQEDRP
jgi:hypothetical protein